MRSVWFVSFAASLTLLGSTAAARAQITPIGPFTGTHFDNFNNIGPGGGGGVQQVDVFQGFCTVRNALTGTGALKIEFSSNLDGDQVNPRSPPLIFGQLCISEWTFDSPITRYGGYWENNSRQDDATVKFFDINNNLIGQVEASVPRFAQDWTWNGWESTTPITKIRIEGHDIPFFSGFIWWEDFQVTAAAVPEPGVIALLGLTAVVVGVGIYVRRRTAKELDAVITSQG